MYERLYQGGAPPIIHKALQMPHSRQGSPSYTKTQAQGAQGDQIAQTRETGGGDRVILQHRANYVPVEAIALKVRRRLKYKVKR